MKFAILFPGQGSQKVGMGLDLFEQTQTGKEIFTTVDKISGRKISDICLKGPENELNQTMNTQISIIAVSVVLALLLANNLKDKNLSFNPSACLGHSLGELTALWYSGILKLEDLIRLVILRGNLMQNAPEGGMAAVINLDVEKIKSLINNNGLSSKVVIANFNSPNQFVLSGQKTSIESIISIIKSAGGKAIILPVSGAFHSPLMDKSSAIFSKEIDKLMELSGTEARIPIYQNYDGSSSTKYECILEKLKKQMTSPVLWTQTVNNLVNDNVIAFVEVGPGKVLTSLVKKIQPTAECYNIYDLASLKNFTEAYEYKLLSQKDSKTA